VIKIGGADPNFQQQRVEELKQRENRASRGATKSDSSPTGAKTSETVAVSTVAREVGKVNAQVKNTPDVRREKIQAIKDKIDKGEYHVSGEEIAGKVIEDIVRQGK